jgi:hypothetical protein
VLVVLLDDVGFGAASAFGNTLAAWESGGEAEGTSGVRQPVHTRRMEGTRSGA